MGEGHERDAAASELEKVMASATFQGAARSRALLKFLVEETLAGRAARLKEYTLGAEALEKGDGFDPRTDPIVRAEASRLRTRLDRYYETEGGPDTLVISLPKGTYVPVFRRRETGAPRTSNRHAKRWLEGSAAIVVIAAFIATAASWMTNRTAADVTHSLIRLEVELAANGTLGSEVGTDVVVSPDGRRVAFVSRDAAGESHLNTRALDQSSATVVSGSEGARGPFFSPDSQWIGFWADRKLKKAAVAGGPPTIICDAPDLLGASWGDEGFIVAAIQRYQLARVASAGGTPQVIADLTREAQSPSWPQVLPSGKQVLFTAIGPGGPNTASIDLLSLSDGSIHTLIRGGTYGRYFDDRYLAYVNQGALFVTPLDLDRLQVRGSAVPVLNDVAYSSTFGYAQLDVSHDGVLVYRRDAGGGQFVLDSIDASGASDTLISKPAHYAWPRLSFDGRRVALTVTESGAETLLVWERDTNRTDRLGTLPDGFAFPLWTRDGRTLLLGGPKGLAAMGVDEPHTLTSILATTSIAVPWSLSPDGKTLAYYAMGATTGFDLWTVSLDAAAVPAAHTPRSYLATPSFEAYPSFSPDGHWLAYSSNESGAWNIYVRRFPDDGTKIAISTAGGHIPFWASNGRDLLYENEDHRFFSVSYVASGASFHADAPQPWGRLSLGDTGVLANADVTRDGTSVVALMPSPSRDEQSPNHVTLLLNFFDELRRRGL